MTSFPRFNVLSRVFGVDYFISYARKDALDYALKLSAELGSQGFDVFLDQLGPRPQATIPKEVLSQLRSARVLIVVASTSSLQSKAVLHEIQSFRETRRPIHVIDVGTRTVDADWFDMVRGAPRSNETDAALVSGAPSSDVLTRLENSAKFMRARQARRVAIATTSVVLIALLAAIGWGTIQLSDVRALLLQARHDLNDAKIATDAQILITQSQRLSGKLPRSALAYALAACEIAPTKDCRRNLVRALDDQFPVWQMSVADRKLIAVTDAREQGGFIMVDESGEIWSVSLSHNPQSRSSAIPNAFVSRVEFNDDRSRVLTIYSEAQKSQRATIRSALDGKTLFGPVDVSSFVGMSSDGHAVVAASAASGPVEIFDVESRGRISEVHNRFLENGNYAAFDAQNSKILLSFWGIINQHTGIYDVKSGKEDVPLEGDSASRVVFAQFRPDGRTLISVASHRAGLWNVDTGKLIHEFGECELPAAMDPKGTTFACANADGFIRLWRVDSGQELLTTLAHRSRVTALVWAADGSRLISGGQDGKIVVWTPDGTRWLELNNEDDLAAVAFSGSGGGIASIARSGSGLLWRSHDWRQRWAVDQKGTIANQSIQFTPNGDQYLGQSNDKTWMSWDGVQGKSMWSRQADAAYLSLDGSATVLDVPGDADEPIRRTHIVDMATGQPLRAPLDGAVRAVAGNSGLVLIAMTPMLRALYSLKSETPPVPIPSSPNGVERFSASGQFLVVSRVGDNTPMLIDTKSGRTLFEQQSNVVGLTKLVSADRGRVLLDLEGGVAGHLVRFNRDIFKFDRMPFAKDVYNGFCAIGQDTKVAAWIERWEQNTIELRFIDIAGADGGAQVSIPENVHTRGGDVVKCSAMSDRALARANPRTLMLFDARGARIAALNVGDAGVEYGAYEFSADGRFAAATSNDGRYVVWDAADGSEIAHFTIPGSYPSGGIRTAPWFTDTSDLVARSTSHVVHFNNPGNLALDELMKTGRAMLSATGALESVSTARASIPAN